MYCPSCGAQNIAEARFCQSCGKALPAATPEPTAIEQAPTKPALPAWPTGEQPYRPAQPIASRVAPVASAATVPVPTPTPVTVAGVLYFLVAFGTAGLGALQLLIGSVGYALWNIAIGVLLAFIGFWILQRQRRGYSWGLWSAIISIVSGVVQAISAPSIIVFFIPFYVVVAVILWTNREHFTK